MSASKDRKIVEMHAEIAKLRQDLAAARARVAELEGERDIWHKECDRREDERIKAEQRTDFARQRAERAEADLAAARALLKQAREEWVDPDYPLADRIGAVLAGEKK